LLQVVLGDYVLSAVSASGAPDFGTGAEARVDIAVQGTRKAFVRILDAEYEVTPGGSIVATRTPLLTENSEIAIYVTGPVPSALRTAPRADSSRELFSRGGFQHFAVRYRGAVGEVAWTWQTPVGTVTIGLECFPSKLDYRSDFEAIRNDLEAVAPSLTASAWGAAGGGFSETSGQAQVSELEWLELVRRHHQELRDAIALLLPNLRRQLGTSRVVVPLERMRRARPTSRRAYGLRRPGTLVQVTALSEDESTPINGHLRWELERLRAIAVFVSSASWFEQLDPNLREPVEMLTSELAAWCSRLNSIRPVSATPSLHVRLRDPVYEKAFRSIRALRAGLEPLKDAQPVGLKDLPTLYEYWVFVRLVEILRKAYPHLRSRTAPLVRRAGADLVLAPGSASEVVLADDSGHVVRCQYNRLFTQLPTTNQKPDAVISISGVEKTLIVDAKYRLGRDQEYVRRYGVVGPLAEDINVLHRYRDAIVAPQEPHRRLSNAGIIAFPGEDSARYRRHRFFRSWHAVRIAGIPMLPSALSLMEETILGYLASGAGDHETNLESA